MINGKNPHSRFIITLCLSLFVLSLFNLFLPGIMADSTGSVVGPDVVTEKTDYPELIYIGKSFQITDSIKNIGGSDAGIVRIEYFLTTDPDRSDGKHLGWIVFQNLKAGETQKSTKNLGIPDNVRPGMYYLTKKITVTSSVPESDKSNNFWSGESPVIVQYDPSAKIPDLTHISTKFPCINPGSSGDIVDTVTNIGNACAEDVSVAYYISSDQNFNPGNARYLGVWKINNICVGEQITHTTHVAIPDLKNGEYYWFAVIDPCAFITSCSQEMPELDKSNNIMSAKGTVGPCVFCNC